MKAAIPQVITGNDLFDRFYGAVKENLDGITGQQQNAVKLKPLEATATNEQIIAQLNAILQRIQG